jgi:hypothetical protein
MDRRSPLERSPIARRRGARRRLDGSFGRSMPAADGCKRVRGLAWLALALICALGRNVAAAEADAQSQARAAYSAGVDAFQHGDLAGARQHFIAAEAAFPSPNIKLMLGRTLVRLGRLPEAHAMLNQVLDTGRGAARYDATVRAATEELRQLDRNLTVIHLRIDDPTGRAVLRVGDREIARDDWEEPIVSEPGAIRIALIGPDGQSDVKQLELSAGGAASLAMVLPAEAPTPLTPPLRPVSPTPSAADASQPTAADAAGHDQPLRPFSYAAAGVGTAGLVAFGVLGTISNHEFDKLEHACPSGKACGASYQDTATRGRTYQTLANVSLAVGVASIAAGLVLWLVSLPGEHADVAATGDGVQLRGSF